MQPRGDQRAMAGLGIALDAGQGGPAVAGEPSERREVAGFEDLLGVEAAVYGRQFGARAFALTPLRVLAVLRFTHLCRRRELLHVDVLDALLGQRRLESARVRP